MKKIPLAIASFTCMVFAGCASTSMIVPKEIPDQKVLERRAEESLVNSPAVVKVKMPANAFVLAEPEIHIPSELDVKLSHVEFYNQEIQTILYSIAKHNPKLNFIYEAPRYPTFAQNFSQKYRDNVSQNGSIAANFSGNEQFVERQDRNRLISISYTGDLSGFLKALSNTTGYFFQYDSQSRAIVVKERDTFNVIVPNYGLQKDAKKEQDKQDITTGLNREVEASLINLGGRDLSYDPFTSSISFSTDALGLKRIKGYLQNLRDNACLVTLQVLLLNVNLTNEHNAGIDWSKMIVGYKKQAQNPFGIAALNQQSGTTGTVTGAVTGTTGVEPLGTGVGSIFTSTGAELFVEAKNFSLSMLLNFIEQYGYYHISQNIRVEAMSGTKGRFAVLTQTPYVSEVQFSALSQQSVTATQAFKSAKAKSGVEMEILPYYNRKEGSLTMALKVSVLGARLLDLDAGQQLGKVTQAEETIKEIENFLRVSPTHIAVIGGLQYEKANNNSSGIPGESYLTKTYGASVEKNELVLVVKPTVYEFE